jgi:hypothetical protein
MITTVSKSLEVALASIQAMKALCESKDFDKNIFSPAVEAANRAMGNLRSFTYGYSSGFEIKIDDKKPSLTFDEAFEILKDAHDKFCDYEKQRTTNSSCWRPEYSVDP